MTPLVFLNGVLLGTSASIAFGLCVVMLLFAMLGKGSPQVAPEWDVLSTYTVIFIVMTALCAFSFIGHLKKRHWRWYAQFAMGVGLMATLFKIFGP
jgi:peptidoglycan biosynthesis protein MviN/MurJ (putative lipid II flippase)